MDLSLKPEETALVLIDLQGGTAARQLAPHTAAEVIARSAKLADAVRAAGGTVIYVHVLLNEIVRLPADNPMQRSAEPPPASASELVPEAGYEPGTDVLITKRQWGAFHATNLDQVLRRKGIRTLIMAGIATNFGVESTARAAQEHGYALVFAEDAMSSMSAAWHGFSVENIFPVMGHVRRSEEIAKALTNAQ